MLNPASLFGEGFAWYSIEGSFSELRQIAHVSADMSQDHIATADHFRTWKIGAAEDDEEEEDLSFFPVGSV